MGGVRDHQELDAWKLANEVRIRIWQVTSRPGFREHLWLRTQLRRAANSGCSNTGEGFSRYSPRDFARFLNIAKGSMTEIIEHMREVRHFELASPHEADEIESYARRTRGAMTGLIKHLRSCHPRTP